MYFTRAIFPIIILASGVHFGRADLTMVQEIESFENNDAGHKEQFMWQISGKRVRLDVGQMMSSIILKEKKVTYSISHEAQQYAVLPHDQVEGVGGAPVGASLSKPIDEPSLEPTGKEEKISGYKCRQVLSKDKTGAVTEIWLTDGAMDLQTFLKEFQELGEATMPQMMSELERFPALRGVPIRVIHYEGAKIKMRFTVKRLDANKIPDSAFEVPAGYAEVKIQGQEKRGD